MENPISINLIDNEQIKVAVKKLFINTDNRDWKNVNSCFASKVFLDYTSFAGGKSAVLTPQEITGSWSGFLPKFDATHHQIGNIVVKSDKENADVFCYGTAMHFKKIDSNNNVWIVVGTYDFHLIRKENNWLIDKMKFNFNFQYGNEELPKMVMNS